MYVYLVCMYILLHIFLALCTIFLMQDLSLWPMDSPAVALAQWLWYTGCFSSACAILVSQLGIKLTFPKLQGGFSTIGPPGKSSDIQKVQLLSRVHLFVTPWTTARQAFLSITNSWSLLKLISIESVTPSNHLILCRPLLLLPSVFPSIRVFSNESILHIRWPKYCSFSFSISPSNEYSELISFRMNTLDLLAVQGTLKSLLLHHSSKADINSSSLSFLYIPNLTSIPDYWKNDSFD